MARCNKPITAALPNLFLATTYALNKSNSKRVCIGLEYSTGYFREVVKLITAGGWNKTVTLDRHSWECFKDQFAVVDSYFTNSYAFYHDHSRPNKLYLPRHDLIFTTSYGTKSILLEERPRKLVEITSNPALHSKECCVSIWNEWVIISLKI